MSTLERRLHVLLDQERYERLQREAEQQGVSIGAVVRGAIDEHLGCARLQARRAAAAQALIDSADEDDGPAETWDDMMAAAEAETIDRLGP